MNILLVNWNDRENPHAGGAEVHVHEIFGRLVRLGHRVELVASGWPGGAERTVVDGIAVRRVGDRNSFAFKGRGEVRAALSEQRYDVVVEDINKIPLFLAGQTRLPFCVIIPHLFGTTVFAEASWPLAVAVWGLEKAIPLAYRRAAFHAISDSTRDDLIARGIPAARITVIYPGVDAEWYRPDPASPRNSSPTFLYVGRLKRYKGVETALRAFAAARQIRPDLAFDVAGQGDDLPRLRQVAATLGVGAAVRFRGFVTEAEKRELLRRAWAVVFPSPKEGWGISNVEAAACGTPALASDSPGLRESVRHGVTGYLVPHGDVDALTRRMVELAGDVDLVERLGRGARAFATTLSWDAAAASTERHLAAVIAKGGATG